MDRTWLLSVSSKNMEACGSYSWKWILPWSRLWGKLQWRCQQGNKMRKGICEGTCWEDLRTWDLHTSEQAPPLPGNTNQSQVVISFLGSPSTTWSMHLYASPQTVKKASLGSTPSEVTMSPRRETRQLQVDQGQVYSVQSHRMKTGGSDWKLENWGELREHWKKEVGWKRFLVGGPELNGFQFALRPPCRRKVDNSHFHKNFNIG